MSRLLFLKEWITLTEAAEHLSAVLSEPISVADLYRFALSGHLTLSANFVNHGRAFLGKKVAIRDARFKVLPDLLAKDDSEPLTKIALSGDALPEFEAWLRADESHRALLAADQPRVKFVYLDGVAISATECIQFERQVASIEGVWDLPMVGGERLDIEHALQALTGGPPVELTHMEGAFVSRSDGTYAQILEHFKNNEFADDELKSRDWNDSSAYYPANGIPEDVPLVIRPESITTFVANVSGSSSTEEPLDERERVSLLCIIGALAKAQGLDLSHPHKAGAVIAAMLPPDVRLSARTIGEHLKAVPEALDSRRG